MREEKRRIDLPGNRTAAIEGCLRDARTSKKRVDDLIKMLEGVEIDHYLAPSKDDELQELEDDYDETPEVFLYDRERFRELYLGEIIRRFVLNTEKPFRIGMDQLTALKLLRAAYDISPDYQGDLKGRRVEFAKANGFVTNSQNEDTLARNCANRENKIIHLIAEGIEQEQVRTKQSLGIAFAVYEVMHRERDKKAGKLDPVTVRNNMPHSPIRDIMPIIPRGEPTAFPEYYLRLSKVSLNEYKMLGTSQVQDSLAKKHSLYALDKEFISETARVDKNRVHKGITNLLKNDPIFAYMVIRAMCGAEVDPVIPYSGTSAIEDSSVPEIITGRGKVFHNHQPWAISFINHMENFLCSRVLDDKNPRHEEIYRADLWAIFDIYSEFVWTTFEQMIFKGVVFARSSRNYRLYPELLRTREFCVKSDPVQLTADWLIYDYMSELGKIAFSVGFRPDELRCAVFSPFRNFCEL